MIKKTALPGSKSSRWNAIGLAIGAALVFTFASGSSVAKPPVAQASIHTVTLAELPAQGREVYALIHKGGPFKYDKDGVVFGNRERILPQKTRGYYHEYTVKTPSSKDRGPKRIVCGGNPPSQPEVCYYTDDHYNSFRKITP